MKINFLNTPIECREANRENMETRMVSGLEVRSAEGSKPGLRGYAAVFNSESEDFGGWREVIDPGAFAKDLASKADIRALIDHNTGRVIGRTKNGTLTLRENAKGLLVEVDLPDTQDARDLQTLVARGDVDQMSFGFRARDEDFETRDGYRLRHVKDAELFEVSVVTFPAYPQTEVGKRSYNRFLDTQKNENKPYRVALRKRSLAAIDRKLKEG